MSVEMRALLASALATLILTSCVAAARPQSVAPSAPPAPTTPSARPTGGLQTVTYCAPQGVPLAMDIAVPSPAPASAAPAVLYVHGGGWEHGDRYGGGFLEQLRPALLARGFVVASIDYRLAPQYRWPAQIEDAKCAVRYLRANASRYGIDPARLGAWGGSAGGHLVSLMGTADASAGFDVGEYAAISSRLQAVVDLFGPADLTAAGWGSHAANVVRDVFGVQPGQPSDTLVRASPVTYVSRDDPPFLILQGDRDRARGGASPWRSGRG